MSEFIKSLLKNPISYEAKEVACHAIEKYVNKLLNTSEFFSFILRDFINHVNDLFEIYIIF